MQLSRTHLARGLFVLLTLCVCGAAGGLLLGFPHANSQAATAVPTADPRLILHPRTLHWSGVTHGVPYRLSLYPAIPGANRMRLDLPHPLGGRSHLHVVFTMLGMAMPPQAGTLTWSHHAYRGSIAVSMFGPYAVHLAPGLQVRAVVPLPSL